MAERTSFEHSARANRIPSRSLASAAFSPGLRKVYACVRGVPVLGPMARAVAASFVPRGRRVWAQVHAGFAQGLWLNADPRYERLFVEGTYEAGIQKLLAEHLGQTATFYDVGSHIGFFSLIAARLVGQSGRVFAFEADPQNVRRIKQHVSRNGSDQISVVAAAVWSRPGTLRFEPGGQSSSRNTGAIVTHTSQCLRETFLVESTTLDEFAMTHRPPDVVKVDIEGAEAEALKGAEKLFSNVRPHLICEVHDAANARFLERWSQDMRYTLRWLQPPGPFPAQLVGSPN
jgi:FkbM family methyltransferase